jgi:general secretion pathway protein A
MSLYNQAFGLSKDPFNMTPDPELLFMTAQHREALAGLAYSILDRKGFAVLTGSAGTGKTTLLSAVLKSLPTASVRSAVLFNPTLNAAEFLEMALLDFGIVDVPASKALRINRIQKLLLEWNAQGKVPTLIVDEAHKLTPEVLEEIRLLSNFEFSDRKLLQIILVGQPELRDILNRDDLRQLKQRIALRFTIAPLSAQEVASYLQYRWTRAGGNVPMPISASALELLTKASEGIPRVLNAICDNALLLSFGKARTTIEETDVRTACSELEVPLGLLNGNTNGNLGGHSPAPPPALAVVNEIQSLRTLGAYDGPKRSLWKRLVGRN